MKSSKTPVKVGTMPGEVVWLRAEDKKGTGGILGVGSKVEFKRLGNGERWQGARVWQIHPERIFLELE